MLRQIYRQALGAEKVSPPGLAPRGERHLESLYAEFKGWCREAARWSNPALLTFAVVSQVLTWLHLLGDEDRAGRWAAAVGERVAEARRRFAAGGITREDLDRLLGRLAQRADDFRGDPALHRHLYRVFCERVVARLPARGTRPPEGADSVAGVGAPAGA